MTNLPSDIRLIVRVRPTSEHDAQITSCRLGQDYDGEFEILDEGVDEHSITLGYAPHPSWPRRYSSRSRRSPRLPLRIARRRRRRARPPAQTVGEARSR